MSFKDIEDFINTDSAQSCKKHFEKHCDWCWWHGYGNCKICKRQFHKVYIPLAIAEKQKELGLKVTR